MTAKLVRWTPRILTILAILFFMMFSLDEFTGSESLGKHIIGFLMHNIPAWIMVIALIISWKRELYGGICFVLCAIAFSIVFRTFAGNPYSAIVLAPVLITGLLFIFSHFIHLAPAEKN